MADLTPQLRQTLPAVLQDAGEDTSDRVIEFFTAEIRNPNTRKAYARAVRRFFQWAHQRQLDLSDIEPFHVAAYVEEDERAPATVKNWQTQRITKTTGVAAKHAAPRSFVFWAELSEQECQAIARFTRLHEHIYRT